MKWLSLKKMLKFISSIMGVDAEYPNKQSRFSNLVFSGYSHKISYKIMTPYLQSSCQATVGLDL